MPFRVTARTILQLGAELISSDPVAFYELIKNSFDARSKRVEIDIVIRIPEKRYRPMLLVLLSTASSSSADVDTLRSSILEGIDNAAPEVDELKKMLTEAVGILGLTNVLRSANYIRVRDTGKGMSLEELDGVYLTIGTRSKLKINEEDGQPVLGEKGLGRLSTMRLGSKLFVRSTKSGDKYWNHLMIDWTSFSHASDDLVEQVPVSPERGSRKTDPLTSGTDIVISSLESEWSEKKLEKIAVLEFNRLTDPFTPSKRYRVTLRFNGDVITIPPVNKILFDHADATMDAEVSEVHGRFQLSGKINYRFREKELPIYVSEDHLVNVAGLQTAKDLKRLGTFQMKLYWFNRKRLTAIDGIGDVPQVREILDRWGGGLMLFRDGFRVNPYGSPADDWLELDPAAFRARGYKINRKQIIGKVDISRAKNPALLDQTNREGLRDNPEKHALVSILQHLLATLRQFTIRVDDSAREEAELDLDAIEQRVEESEGAVQKTLQEFLNKYPRERRLADAVQSLAIQMRDVIEQAQQTAASFENRQSQLVNLAALGLMVEIIAHELNRSTQHTLTTIADADVSELPEHVQHTFETLESQLRTLQKRLKTIDPMSTAGRQRKETFEVVGWIRDILDTHKAQFERHDIKPVLLTVPAKGAKLLVRAVPGMIVQITENLISNSVYWLKKERAKKPGFKPEIEVMIDTVKRRILFSDNGPGVEPDRREEIFYPFVTTKPAREGKGLGLYISKEIAKYNGAEVYLSEKPKHRPDRLHTFVLQLGAE